MEQEAGFSGLVVPHGTYHTCLALQSNGFDHPRPLSGVDTSVVGASQAHTRFGGAGRRSQAFDAASVNI
jgi:hypothetical protein